MLRSRCRLPFHCNAVDTVALPNRRISTLRVLSRLCKTLQDTGTLPGVRVTAEREVHQSIDEQENQQNAQMIHIFSVRCTCMFRSLGHHQCVLLQSTVIQRCVQSSKIYLLISMSFKIQSSCCMLTITFKIKKLCRNV